MRNPPLEVVAVAPVSSDWIGASPGANVDRLSWAVIGSRDANPIACQERYSCHGDTPPLDTSPAPTT